MLEILPSAWCSSRLILLLQLYVIFALKVICLISTDHILNLLRCTVCTQLHIEFFKDGFVIDNSKIAIINVDANTSPISSSSIVDSRVQSIMYLANGHSINFSTRVVHLGLSRQYTSSGLVNSLFLGHMTYI